MKRKRGHKKGKSKKRKSQSPIVPTTTEESPNNDIESVNSEENNSGSEEEDNNKVQEVSKPISEPVMVSAPAMPVKAVETMPVLPKVFQRPTPTAVYGRVKLKLKTTPKPPPPVEPQVVGSSVGQVQGDGVKNSEVGSVVEKKDDKEVISGEKVDGSSKKSGVIKIVSSKSSSPPALGGVESGKVVNLKSSSPLASVENESGKAVAKSSSPLASAENENESGKIVSLKSSSLLASAENENESGKVVSLKSSSPLASAENESGKLVSLKSSSPMASAENESGKIVSLKISSSLASGCNESDKIVSPSSTAVDGNGNESGKAVFMKNSSPPVSVSIESGNAVSLKSSSIPASGGKESGKIVFSKNSSPPSSGGKESGKIVIRKSSSPPTSSGGKIVIRKSSSPPTSGGGKIIVSKSSSAPALDGKESGVNDLSQNEEKVDEYKARFPQQEAKCNKEELEASLEVIQKIMKMDAAEPFNVPVDPIGLGIPDYFDVIDTPMDFGTICSNLESGKKYMDSEDVYKDVQYIWDNCSKYNNKGDYIVDLMKRVKKNFMKYWMAAGLYTEQTQKMKGEEGSPLDEPTTSGHGKKLKKGKGVKRHKDDCLCAICIMKRRRREREACEAQLAREMGGQVASPQIKVPKTGLHEEYRQEDISHAESPVETSSYMETSHDGDADAEMEDVEMKPDAVASQYNNEKSEIDRAYLHDKSDRSGDISEKSLHSDKGDAELYSHDEVNVQDEFGSRFNNIARHQPLLQQEGQKAGYLQHRQELLEMEKKRQKLRMLETFRDLENPKLLGLCETLFPNNVKTVWNGANSLLRCERTCHRRDIHEAVASFMNPPCKSASFLK
ncbi:homeotic protein female sterile-like [Chenopodium quinoa]|uniref:Bromo domain-containing protein n=1 Tax=Chenopodium quinoa TaxID=63459 RepID=A0A803MF37_CHEQI|nr:homeotic protein female sterile-like [Chenopodium quinoa]